ncbi:MAG: hypothetical protein IPP13_28335 [Kouleothrix sp.]|jgi:hypothetical protein|nr:hypothetical protein [Kouleothrix sp.]
MTSENPAPIPAEQLPITLFDAVVLAVRADDGAIFLSVRDVCATLSIDFSSQLRRLRDNAILQRGLRRFQVMTAGGSQQQYFLELEKIPTWLMMINAARIPDERVRERLTWLQDHLVRAVYREFAALAGLPEHDSRQIEDLVDLERINTALDAIAEAQEQINARQSQLEQSQDRARQAWLDLRNEIRTIATRLGAVEQRVGGVISHEQRGYLYQLVQAWGAAKAAREPRLTKSAAYAACWALLKAKYRIARYEDLPAAKYADCIAFVQQSYRALTGADLDLPEQASLNLE